MGSRPMSADSGIAIRSPCRSEYGGRTRKRIAGGRTANAQWGRRPERSKPGVSVSPGGFSSAHACDVPSRACERCRLPIRRSDRDGRHDGRNGRNAIRGWMSRLQEAVSSHRSNFLPEVRRPTAKGQVIVATGAALKRSSDAIGAELVGAWASGTCVSQVAPSCSPPAVPPSGTCVSQVALLRPVGSGVDVRYLRIASSARQSRWGWYCGA